jgi:AcrR family transcriptional regulator
MAVAGTDQDTTDARILAAALDHVRRYGYERTTVVSVARDAGMTHANVYRYFSSKLALADALTAAWLKPVEADLAVIADAPDPADDKLERLLLAWASALRDALEQDPNLFDVFTEASSAMRGVARKHRARVRMLIERILEEGVGSGIFVVKRTERAVALIHDGLFRFIHPLAIRLDRDVPRRLLDERLGTVVRSTLRTLKAGGT